MAAWLGNLKYNLDLKVSTCIIKTGKWLPGKMAGKWCCASSFTWLLGKDDNIPMIHAKD